MASPPENTNACKSPFTSRHAFDRPVPAGPEVLNQDTAQAGFRTQTD